MLLQIVIAGRISFSFFFSYSQQFAVDILNFYSVYLFILFLSKIDYLGLVWRAKIQKMACFFLYIKKNNNKVKQRKKCGDNRIKESLKWTSEYKWASLIRRFEKGNGKYVLMKRKEGNGEGKKRRRRRRRNRGTGWIEGKKTTGRRNKKAVIKGFKRFECYKKHNKTKLFF